MSLLLAPTGLSLGNANGLSEKLSSLTSSLGRLSLGEPAPSTSLAPVPVAEEKTETKEKTEPKTVALEEKKKSSKNEGFWTILPRQIPHFTKIKEILQNNAFYIDYSKTGRGKTFVALFVKETLFKHILVIGPVSSQVEWENAAKNTGIKVDHQLSYDMFRGTSSGVNHKFLDLVGKGDDVDYSVTKYCTKLLDEGMLVVFDEAHKGKNLTLVNKAIRAMMRAISQSRNSRAAFLSGTLFDKEEHATNFCRIFNYIRHATLLQSKGGKTELLGVGELKEKAMEMDTKKTLELFEDFGNITSKNAKKLVYELFVKVILPRVGSGMMYDMKIEKDAKNGYYKITDDTEREEIKKAVGGLTECLKSFDEEKGEKSELRMASLMNALVELERVKRPLLKRLILRDLRANANVKIVVFVENKDTILELCKYINHEIGDVALPFYGEVKQETRNRIIDLFNQDNNLLRVIVANINVGGVGVSLHDCTGNHPRITYGLARYNFSALVQAVGRTEREGTQSPIKIRFVYAYGIERDQIPKESSILSAIIRKTKVQASITGESEEIYPGSYVDEVCDS